MATATFVLEDEEIHVPEFVSDLESFREWFYSHDFPVQGRICFLQGLVWVDTTMEQVFSHVKLKGIFYLVLGGLVINDELGELLSDGLRLVNKPADISVEPDCTFISNVSIDSKKVRFIKGKEGGFVEAEGSPDMVLEVLSDSSEKKDKVLLKAAYEKAGIPEYWMVDARKEKLIFEINRLTPKGYVSAKKQEGWIKSNVFGKTFRLTVTNNKRGHPAYRLEMR